MFPGGTYGDFPVGSRTATVPVFDGFNATVNDVAVAADDGWANRANTVDDGW